MPEFSDYVESRTAAPTLDGSELLAGSKDGEPRKWTTQQVANLNPPAQAVTREFNRTFVDALVFNKNEIFHAPFTLTGDLSLTIGSGGLVDQASGMRFRFTTDGTHAIFFGAGFDFLYPAGLVSGVIPEAGTYEMYLLYTNGSVVVNLPGASSEASSLQQLLAPTGFTATADGENDIDLAWVDVDEEVGYQIEKSLTGTGGWVLFSNPAVDATTDTETGLNPGDTVFYRIKAVGDGVSFADSPYATASATTESTGDVTAPTFIFFPASGVTDWSVNRSITLTANEAIRNANGTVIDNSNVANVLRVKQTNVGGADIPFTATIDGSKTLIIITPTTVFGLNQLVYVDINNVEDTNGNEVTVAISSTFTTTEFTYFNGTTNRVIFADALDSLFAVNDTNFWLECTIVNQLLSGTHIFISKSDSGGNQRSFYWYSTNTDIYFAWYTLGTAAQFRLIKWTNVLTAGEHTLVLKYDGSIDTNNGLDRLTLLIDGGTAGSKTLDAVSGALGNINNSNAQLAVGISVNTGGTPIGTSFFSGEMKDFIIRSTGGTVEELNVPTLRFGSDTGPGSIDGTWV